MSSTGASEFVYGAAAFAAISRQLAGDEPANPECFAEPALRRLAAALQERQAGGPARPSPLDLGVLVRQALRYRELQTGGVEPAAVRVPALTGSLSESEWGRLGVSAVQVPGGYVVRAHPWRPLWLADVGAQGVDGAAAGEALRRPDTSMPGDPFLASFHHDLYRSPGQQSAVRAALTAPPGSTLLICLPTGDGKSFVFQVISRLGFGDGDPGVTVVITPTVALALDHERAARELGFREPRLAYRGGDASGENDPLIEGIASGTQRLCFASPEAVCGPLRPALLQAARSGLLTALVVDEAHLIDTWGANFRSDFQVLAGVRRTLLAEARGRLPRTILLSATLTRESIFTLRTLFSADRNGAEFAVHVAAYLRPEIEYWAAPVCSEGERQERVLEAVFHLPRPAILYVTERADAEAWWRRLRDKGFRRLAHMTGDSSPQDRQEVVDGWRAGTIDLVVGTSAFGLGIDNAHVRSVIHACVPENLDRFYQEVGRGGRDGRASISLIVPTEEDIRVARGLNSPRQITVDRGLERWRAMFNQRVYDPGSETHLLRLDVPPGADPDRIDMISDRSTSWNLRTVVLMAAAGLISLLGPELGPDGAGEGDRDSMEKHHPYHRVRILDPRHLDRAVWEDRVAVERQRLAAAHKENLKRMLQHLRGSQCAAHLISPLYEVPGLEFRSGETVDVKVARACGGCPHCRDSGREPYLAAVTPTPFPWPGRPVTTGLGAKLLDEGNRVVVFYPRAPGDMSAPTWSRFLESLAYFCRQSGIRNVICPPELGLDLRKAQQWAPTWPLFHGHRVVGHGLPPGPVVAILPPGTSVKSAMLSFRPATDARFYFLSDDTADPTTPGVLLSSRHQGRQLGLDEFLRQVQP